MNYLSLCKRLRLEAGYSGQGPASVAGQSGEMKRIVEWVASSWLQIQSMRSDWRFMATEFSVSMAAASNSVAISATVKSLKPDSVVVTRPDGAKVFPKEVTIEVMRQQRREKDDLPSYPAICALDDAGALHVFPTLSEDVTVVGEFYQKPVLLADNTDVPNMPEEYHLLIVWHALAQTGGFDEASNVYLRANENYVTLYNLLSINQAPSLQGAYPLA